MMTMPAIAAGVPRIVNEDSSHLERLLKRKLQGELERIESGLREKASGLRIELIAAIRVAGTMTLRSENTKRANQRGMKLKVPINTRKSANRPLLKCLLLPP